MRLHGHLIYQIPSGYRSTNLTPASQSSHPSLSEVKKEPPSRRLPATVVSILNVGVPVLDLLKEVLDLAGVVPFLSPTLSTVTGLLHATQLCVKCLLY